jgi:hypothetical protein
MKTNSLIKSIKSASVSQLTELKARREERKKSKYLNSIQDNNSVDRDDHSQKDS